MFGTPVMSDVDIIAQVTYVSQKLQQQQQQPSLLVPSKLGRLEMKPHEPKKQE
jgi:hypothetical protein